jgi:hypothetical protein
MTKAYKFLYKLPQMKDVYWGVQGACPQRAVTHAGGTAEHRAIGMGLKLVP